MGNIKIIKGVFDTKLELERAEVVAGFPINIDYSHETLDFNRDYIKHPEASFYGDVEGDSMIDAGFTMKYLDLKHKDDGYIELRPANDEYPVFKIDTPEYFEVWGVVIHVIRTLEKV